MPSKTHPLLILTVGILAALACGCSITVHSKSKSTRGSSSRVPEQFKHRLEAANNIMDIEARDESLSMIANDAARDGFAACIHAALDGIMDTDLRDSAAAECASTLVDQGSVDAAMKVIDTIIDVDSRDAAFAEIAQRSTPAGREHGASKHDHHEHEDEDGDHR